MTDTTSQEERFEQFGRDLDLISDLPPDILWTDARPILISRKRAVAVWADPQARLGGVVAAGSRCNCHVNEACTVLRSPRWGEWDVCQPCGTEQLRVLHGGDISNLVRPDLVAAEAVRSLNLDSMLSLAEEAQS